MAWKVMEIGSTGRGVSQGNRTFFAHTEVMKDLFILLILIYLHYACKTNYFKHPIQGFFFI